MLPMLRPAGIKWEPPLILYTPPRPAPAELPKAEARGNQRASAPVMRAVFQPRFTAPTRIPSQISLVGDDPPPVAAGIDTNAGGSAISDLVSGVPLPTPKPAPEAQTPKPKPTSVRVGSGVQQAMLIRQVKPPYPPLARAARISGVVRLAAIIAKDGSIQNLQLLSGHPLLAAAAMEAVRQWRYKPTLLSGEPVEVITEIEVNFTLSN
jgi:protein TonB